MQLPVSFVSPLLHAASSPGTFIYRLRGIRGLIIRQTTVLKVFPYLLLLLFSAILPNRQLRNAEYPRLR